MAEKTWGIRVTLVNGETRLLAHSYGTAEETAEYLTNFEDRAGNFQGDWLDTDQSSSIARAHILELHIVPVA